MVQCCKGIKVPSVKDAKVKKVKRHKYAKLQSN